MNIKKFHNRLIFYLSELAFIFTLTLILFFLPLSKYSEVVKLAIAGASTHLSSSLGGFLIYRLLILPLVPPPWSDTVMGISTETICVTIMVAGLALMLSFFFLDSEPRFIFGILMFLAALEALVTKVEHQ